MLSRALGRLTTWGHRPSQFSPQQPSLQTQQQQPQSQAKAPQPLLPIVGLDSRDDAAVLSLEGVPRDAALVQTVDFFRSFVSDPFVFGQLAAHHALGDCYAMGARPGSALAVAVVPVGLEDKMEEDLFQVLAGAQDVLAQAGCQLAGGHTAEGDELSLGFCITGAKEPFLCPSP